jgi:ABC-type multidrug transport system ATPase subunit
VEIQDAHFRDDLAMNLQVRGLSLRYPKSANYVFRNLSASLETPGFNALFGPSGVGKTSLARMITGDLKPEAGEIRAEGMQILLYSYNLERLPGWSSVSRHLSRVTPTGRGALRDSLIEDFGLQDCIHQRFAELSLGQRNRVNLLRYLLQDFDLLIMDESLANVDELTREKIILRIKEIFPDAFFLYISHNLVEVTKFCNHILVMPGGESRQPATVVQGRDLRRGRRIDKKQLDRTMLEIVNASG